MRKEKVCLGLFNVLVEKKNQQMLLFLLPHHEQALLVQRSVLTSVSSGSWSGVTFDILPFQVVEAKMPAEDGSDQSSVLTHARQRRLWSTFAPFSMSLLPPDQEPDRAWSRHGTRARVPVHLHFPTLASGMWGRNTAWDLGSDVPGVLAVHVCVCGYMSMIGVWVHDVCQGACACVWRLP